MRPAARLAADPACQPQPLQRHPADIGAVHACMKGHTACLRARVRPLRPLGHLPVHRRGMLPGAPLTEAFSDQKCACTPPPRGSAANSFHTNRDRKAHHKLVAPSLSVSQLWRSFLHAGGVSRGSGQGGTAVGAQARRRAGAGSATAACRGRPVSAPAPLSRQPALHARLCAQCNGAHGCSTRRWCRARTTVTR